MKTAVRLLVRFILWFAVLVLIVSAFIVAYNYVTGYDPQSSSAFPFLAMYLSSIIQVFIPTALFTGVVGLFDILRLANRPALPLALMAVLWSALFVVGVVLLQQDSPFPTRTPAVPVGTIMRGPEVAFYAGDRDGQMYGPVAIRFDNSLRVSPSAELVSSGEALLVEQQQVRIALNELTNSYGSLVEIPAPLSGLAQDVRATNAFLRTGAAGGAPGATETSGLSTPALLTIGALSLFLLGLWTLARFTRWPLFNAVLVIAAWRFSIWIVPAAQTGVLRSMIIAGFSSNALTYAPAIVLAGTGALLFVSSVLLPSLDTWKREL